MVGSSSASFVEDTGKQGGSFNAIVDVFAAGDARPPPLAAISRHSEL
jgi:hypothetical protein